MIRIFKFGGSSIRNIKSIKKIAKIIQEHQEDQLIVIFSAIGKVTNMLEEVVNSYFSQDGQERLLLKGIRDFHEDIARELFEEEHSIFDDINNLFIEIEWLIDEVPINKYAYNYDQIVSIGELLSSKIMSAYLTKTNFNNHWIDIRDIIRTDDSYRNAKVNWEITSDLAQANLKKKNIITQGFIGSNSENCTTTLGREGSDFTAAILAFSMNAGEVVIWKDVPGLMNADPVYFPEAKLFSQMSFDEAIELAFFGAKVIHPKTIQPLKKKSIPLRIKSFLHPQEHGTLIAKDKKSKPELESYIIKENQILISISARDLSFIVEDHISKIFSILSKNIVGVNMMQNSAISFSICVDNDQFKIPTLISDLQEFFKVVYNKSLSLYTIKNYKDSSVKHLVNQKNIILQQKTRHTFQIVASK